MKDRVQINSMPEESFFSDGIDSRHIPHRLFVSSNSYILIEKNPSNHIG